MAVKYWRWPIKSEPCSNGVMLMDGNIYNLNLDYLIVAHELILTGNHEQALLCLGLTMDAVNLLKNLPIAELKKLARSDVFSFAPRFPASQWAAFLSNEPIGNQPGEQSVRHLRILLAKPSLKPL